MRTSGHRILHQANGLVDGVGLLDELTNSNAYHILTQHEVAGPDLRISPKELGGKMGGYSDDEINQVLTGRRTLEELLNRHPESAQ